MILKVAKFLRHRPHQNATTLEDQKQHLEAGSANVGPRESHDFISTNAVGKSPQTIKPLAVAVK